MREKTKACIRPSLKSSHSKLGMPVNWMFHPVPTATPRSDSLVSLGNAVAKSTADIHDKKNPSAAAKTIHFYTL
jgi:hypothetical protein